MAKDVSGFMRLRIGNHLENTFSFFGLEKTQGTIVCLHSNTNNVNSFLIKILPKYQK